MTRKISPGAFFTVLVAHLALLFSYITSPMTLGWLVVLLVWLNALIYTLLNLRRRIFATMFLVAYMILLLVRPVLQMTLGVEDSLISPDQMDFLETAFLASIVPLVVTYVILDRRGIVELGKKEFSGKQRGIKRSYFRLELRRLALTVFWVLFPGAVLSYALRLRNILAFGYQDSYTEDFISANSSLILIAFDYMREFAFIALIVFLATLPRLNHAWQPMAAWLVMSGVLVLGGQRRDFMLTALLVVGYALMRGAGGGLYARISKRNVVIAAVASLGIIFVFAAVEQRRGLGAQYDSLASTIPSFLYGQGVSVTTLISSFSHRVLLPDQFYLAEFAHSGIIARLFGIPVYQGNSLDRALDGGSLSHSLSYVVLGQNYLSGVSTGTSFVSEAYVTGGIVGIALLSAIFGFLLAQICRFGDGGLVADTVRLLIVQSVLWAPRGSSTGFIAVLVDPATLVMLAALPLLAMAAAKRGGHVTDSEDGDMPHKLDSEWCRSREQ